MADPVSVLASAVGIAAFAQQLATSVLKMKRSCEDVKNVPIELQETLDQIENMSNIMAKLGRIEEEELDGGVDADILLQSLQLCQRAVSRISALAQEAQANMKRGKALPAVRAALKQDTYAKMLVKLDRSKADLHLAYSMYAGARKAKELEGIRKHMQDMLGGRLHAIQESRSGSLPCEESGREHSLEQHSSRRSRKKARRITGLLRLALPLWLCQRAVDLAFESAGGCWTVSWKAFRVLEPGNEAIDMCQKGDINGIKELVERRQLSIHDEDMYGRTLSTVEKAAGYGQTSMLRLLIGSGAQVIDTLVHRYYSRSHWYEGPFLFDHLESLDQVREHAQLLRNELDIPAGHDLNILAKHPSSLTPEERLTILMRIHCQTRSGWLDMLLPVKDLDVDLFNTVGEGGDRLFHIIAFKLRREYSQYSRRHKNRKAGRRTWFDLLEKVIKLGADIHARNECTQTPLKILLDGSRPGYLEEAVQDRLGGPRASDSIPTQRAEKKIAKEGASSVQGQWISVFVAPVRYPRLLEAIRRN
ncbi:hypothetical protein LTR37_016238 [Vermiconidia calcicola]|uniref:Uncharacterized protein n=1 Tax=Vermiconidia calcicola TaxID=1690605 RepID=A0ACC3MPA4_9PEZI|nr:hypothetical protein LTR37_016238 [Vermiconidia calcicola]